MGAMVAREKMASFASDAPVPVQPGREQVSISVSGNGADALSAGGGLALGLSLVLPSASSTSAWVVGRTTQATSRLFFKTTSVGQS